MNKNINIMNAAFLGGISVVFTLTILYSDGQANINTMGEGLIVSIAYGVLAVFNLRDGLKK